jgi:hypothetical protein
MKSINLFLCGFVLVCFSAFLSPSWADTDYQCLNRCVNAGKTTAACMLDCSYNLEAKPPKGVHPAASPLNAHPNHRLLSTPLPLGAEIKLNKPKPHFDAMQKDYKCMATCLKDTKIYSSCEQQCMPALAQQKKDIQRSTSSN